MMTWPSVFAAGRSDSIICFSKRIFNIMDQRSKIKDYIEEAGEAVWRYFTESREKFNVVYREVNDLED